MPHLQSRPRQCDIKIGTGGRESMLLVAPPRTNSRSRECPYAPMTRRSAFRYVTCASNTSPDAASFGIDFVEDHVGPMSGQVLRELRTRPPGIDNLFFGHGENTNALRFLQNGYRIRHGPSGRPAEIPSHDHGVERE